MTQAPSSSTCLLAWRFQKAPASYPTLAIISHTCPSPAPEWKGQGKGASAAESGAGPSSLAVPSGARSSIPRGVAQQPAARGQDKRAFARSQPTSTTPHTRHTEQGACARIAHAHLAGTSATPAMSMHALVH